MTVGNAWTEYARELGDDMAHCLTAAPPALTQESVEQWADAVRQASGWDRLDLYEAMITRLTMDGQVAAAAELREVTRRARRALRLWNNTRYQALRAVIWREDPAPMREADPA